ncbi:MULTISPECIES: MarR family transcriptional regulator [unclassified Rhizobium]|jgi:DNA-binding MarR family transcriptional regulator|uniref:MarR family winged helix-turn-helix transcriptional regulator n=1 Tax=unclassified Rhizobium TaxID=2613769 RepID=UPI000DDD6435|nr:MULTISPECIES: MarR family transcriptional regulator [unclassified Rhizobium]MBB3291153.1 DNA-binding MarR family transcriptional regulator [Rhizobium sp. BK252]MBB3404185.1 DNA-binding MarR family transcriptional regulator [Rhizobium sp. BK289]MBB3418507.1 DNA-binding MarR family transcriptional regulator [Rhizobium sp. BK284]MBB3486385.1 DNA-binding MarR family transcriptional regulator [Rhizobium sp. BK347]
MEKRVPTHLSLGLLLRLVHQHWAQDVDAALEKAGFDDIRPSHANVFTFMRPEGIQVSELTRLAHVRKQTMTQAVEELERLGYVERRPDPNDRRARLVFLTERGRGVRPVAMAAGRLVDQRWSDMAGSEEIDALKQALQSLLGKLRGGDRNDEGPMGDTGP